MLHSIVPVLKLSSKKKQPCYLYNVLLYVCVSCCMCEREITRAREMIFLLLNTLATFGQLSVSFIYTAAMFDLHFKSHVKQQKRLKAD